MLVSQRCQSILIAGCLTPFLWMTADSARAADPRPMLILDTPAATAYVVDTNDPSRFATAKFVGAAALRKGTFRQVYRTPASIYYQVTIADGAGHLLSQVAEFSLTGAPPTFPAKVGTLPVSNSAASLSVTCSGNYIVVCGDGPTPVSVVNAATGEEVSTLALPNSVSTVVCPLDDVTVLAVEKDTFGTGLGVRRLTISNEGQLTDTTEFLSLPGIQAVTGVPGTGFGVALNRTPMTDYATSFTLAGMTSNGNVPLTGETADSLHFSCGGTSLIVRSNITGAPIDAASIVEVFGFDANLGTITSPASLSFTVGAAPTFSLPGESHVAATSDATLIAATETNAVKLYSSADGSFVREFAPPSLSAGDLSFLSCCQFISVNPPLDEQLIDGPDVNNDMAIDTEIPVHGANPSSYTFRMNLNIPSPVPAFVVEQVGATWDVVSATADVPDDKVILFPGFLGALLKMPTYIIWIPSDNNGSLTFVIRTRRNFFPRSYQPNAAGTVSQTVGAKVFNVFKQPVVDPLGNPVVGAAYDVTGVAAP